MSVRASQATMCYVPRGRARSRSALALRSLRVPRSALGWPDLPNQCVAILAPAETPSLRSGCRTFLLVARTGRDDRSCPACSTAVGGCGWRQDRDLMVAPPAGKQAARRLRQGMLWAQGTDRSMAWPRVERPMCSVQPCHPYSARDGAEKLQWHDVCCAQSDDQSSEDGLVCRYNQVREDEFAVRRPRGCRRLRSRCWLSDSVRCAIWLCDGTAQHPLSWRLAMLHRRRYLYQYGLCIQPAFRPGQRRSG